MSYKVPEITRFEIKFVSRQTNLQEVLHWVRMHSEGFITAYPDRWVNNVYFDSHNYLAYDDNLSGASSRSKVRFRWYGKNNSPDAGTLEIKRKRNMSVWKLLYPVPTAPYAENDSWKDVSQKIKDQIEPQGQKWMNDYSNPILINQYYRRYFVSPDQKVRVTVDDQQRVWDQRFKAFPNFTHNANSVDLVIIEVKFDREERDRVTHILKDIPVRYSRNSKYMTGVWAVHGM